MAESHGKKAEQTKTKETSGLMAKAWVRFETYLATFPENSSKYILTENQPFIRIFDKEPTPYLQKLN